MTRKDLYEAMCAKHSMLCVGLDTDYDRLPACVKAAARGGDALSYAACRLSASASAAERAAAVLAFNRAVIDAVAPHCIALKPNLAFYECLGAAGMAVLEETVAYARERHPELFLIADAKRGDIGNTADSYAKTFFEVLDFDAVTLSPYMGMDTVRPFLGRPGKFAIVVALSSNPSGSDFQEEGKLYRRVIERGMQEGSPEELMFVVGATRADRLAEIRSFCPDHFFLVPGVGAQGGSAEAVMAHGRNALGGLLINSSRGVIYASAGDDFASAAAAAAARTAVFDR